MSTIAKSLRRIHRRAEPAPARSRMEPWSRPDWAIAFVVVLGVLGLVLPRLDLGVVPGDTGALAHSAERAARGELPHRDFDEPYTGALSLLNGLAFKLFGTQVSSMRSFWLVFAVGFAPLTYVLARRFLRRFAAAALTAAIVIWSVPNYPSPMPTWYNLFFTLLGGWCLTKFTESDARRWIAAAGVCAGASFLFKIVGIYFVAAAGLYFVYRAQEQSQRATPSAAHWSWLPLIGLTGFAVCVLWLVLRHPRVPELIVFAGPSLTIAAFLALREWRLRRFDGFRRLRRIMIDAGLFAAGAAVPVGLFLIPYITSHSLYAWYFGVFVAPQARIGDEFMGRPIMPTTFWSAVLLTAMIGAGAALSIRTRNALFVSAIVGIAACMLAVQGDNVVAYGTVWDLLRLLPVVSAGTCAYFLSRAVPQSDDSVRREQTFLWVAIAAVFSLVQFPLAHGIYFLYTAPVILLGAAYIASYAAPRGATAACGESLAFLIAFGALWVIGANSTLLGVCYYPCNWNDRLLTKRADERYDEATARIYNSLISEVRAHSADGEAILALPDCPEVYFLTRRRNPTRTFYDVFDHDYGRPERDRRLMNLIEKKQINVVVLRDWGTVSKKSVSARLDRELRRRFPNELHIGDAGRIVFTLRWRDPPERRPELRQDVALNAP